MNNQVFLCPLCDGFQSTLAATTLCHSDLFSNEFTYRKCSTCGFTSLFPQPDRQTLHRYYRMHEEARAKAGVTSAPIPLDRQSQLKALWTRLTLPAIAAYRRIVTHGRVLDLGCGAGDLVETFVARGLRAEGIDFDRDAIAIAATKGLDVRHADIVNLDLEPNTYDFVVLQHTLEHILNPVSFLRQIRPSLKATGTLVIEVPNVDCFTRRVFGSFWNGWDPPYHVNQFNKRTLVKALNMAGFNVKNAETLSSVEELRRSMLLWRRPQRAQRQNLLRLASVPIYLLVQTCGQGGVLLTCATPRSTT